LASIGTAHAFYAPKPHAGTRSVTVYLLQSGLAVPVAVLARAELVATKIFASVGVPVEWHTRRAGGNSMDAAEAIEMQFDSGLPAPFHEGAFAYAMPYGTGGTRIHVFSDRVLRVSPDELSGSFLGHVMAHEITHVLEGISRHSAEGVMKEHWSIHDFYEMGFRPLPFAIEDIGLIHAGLLRRKPEH